METDPYENLANAVIIQPVRWRNTGRTSRWLKWDEKRKDILTGIIELHDFFCSEWLKPLSNADCPALFERLRKEADTREC